MASTRTKLEGIPLTAMKQKIANASKGYPVKSNKNKSK